MVPLNPPPPSCAACRVQAAGRTTRKLMGLAVVAVSTGAMTPSTLQYGGVLAVAAVHRGSRRVTLETGSPIDATGMADPSFIDVQSESVMAVFEAGFCERAEDAPDPCQLRRIPATMKLPTIVFKSDHIAEPPQSESRPSFTSDQFRSLDRISFNCHLSEPAVTPSPTPASTSIQPPVLSKTAKNW